MADSPGPGGEAPQATPPAVRPAPSYVSDIRAKMFNAGSRSGHPLAKASQVVLIDPDSPASRALQMAKFPRERVDDAMILLVDGAFAPERRPKDLPENSLDMWDPDTGTRLVWLRGHLEWAVDGGIVEVMRGIAQSIWTLLGRFNRRRVMREANNEEREERDDEY